MVAEYQKMKSAREWLEKAEYAVESHENGHLIVADPVMRCGHGAQAGKLIPAGTQSVVIRSFSEAVRFIQARQ